MYLLGTSSCLRFINTAITHRRAWYIVSTSSTRQTWLPRHIQSSHRQARYSHTSSEATMADLNQLGSTFLAFQHQGTRLEEEHEVHVQACVPFGELPEADQQLYKPPAGSSTDDVFAVITKETIFHPQGGGQPSDIGSMTISTSTFNVHTVRTSPTYTGLVLHFGAFGSPDAKDAFSPGSTCTQHIDAAKRLLYSKYHSAGHVLGAAVRILLEKEVPGFDELKASHFPDSASCEFAGLIAGTYKDAIQKQVDDYIAADMPIEIDWWDDDAFRANGLERLIPDQAAREAMGVKEGEKFRVVKIVGAESYPCGGTHVQSTQLCGKTVVKKIARSKGQSRVSYNLPDA